MRTRTAAVLALIAIARPARASAQARTAPGYIPAIEDAPGYGQSKVPLFAEAVDSFFLRAVNAQVTFTPSGVVTGLVLHQSGRRQIGPQGQVMRARMSIPAPPVRPPDRAAGIAPAGNHPDEEVPCGS